MTPSWASRLSSPRGSCPPLDGKVELHGSDWRATAEEAIEAGTPVKVVGRNGLTLAVRRL